MPPAQACCCFYRQLTGCQRASCCCFCSDRRTVPHPSRSPGSPLGQIGEGAPALDSVFCRLCRDYQLSQTTGTPPVNPAFHPACRSLIAHHARLARISRRASPSCTSQNRISAPNSSRVQRRSSLRRDSVSNSSFNSLIYPNLPVTQFNMASYSGHPLQQNPSTPPMQMMINTNDAAPPPIDQNNAPNPYMNTFRQHPSPGYGQSGMGGAYAARSFNSFNSAYASPEFDVFGGGNAMNAAMDTQASDRMALDSLPLSTAFHDAGDPPFTLGTQADYNNDESQRHSITQRIETRITTEVNQNNPTAQHAHAPSQDHSAREHRGNFMYSPLSNRYINTPPNAQMSSFSLGSAPLPSNITESDRATAADQRTRRRYGTLIEPYNSAHWAYEGHLGPSDTEAARAAQARATSGTGEYNGPISESYLRRIRAQGMAAIEQTHEQIRLENGRAHTRAVSARKSRGLDDQNDGRPPAKDSKEMTVNLECKVCMSQLVDTVLIPCGHAVLCRWCARQHMSDNKNAPPKCPMCRVAIKVKYRLYIA